MAAPIHADLARFRSAFTAGLLGQPAELPPGVVALSAQAGIAPLVLAIDHHDPAYVAMPDGSHRRVARADLDCLLMRAWLFGIVSAVEMRIKGDLAASVRWRDLLSPDRLEKARQIKTERSRRGQAADTFSCLQFGDLGQMAVRTSWWQTLLGTPSNRAAKELSRHLEVLRNNLAHSQDIIAQDWEIIVTLAANLDSLGTGSRQPMAAAAP